jgi:hypothetical protein
MTTRRLAGLPGGREDAEAAHSEIEVGHRALETVRLSE